MIIQNGQSAYFGLSNTMSTDQGANKTADEWLKNVNSSLYNPDEESKDFLRKATGIEADEELKQHILKESTRAMTVSLGAIMLKHSDNSCKIQDRTVSMYQSIRVYQVRAPLSKL